MHPSAGAHRPTSVRGEKPTCGIPHAGNYRYVCDQAKVENEISPKSRAPVGNDQATAFCAAGLSGAFRRGCLRPLSGCQQQPLAELRAGARQAGGACGRGVRAPATPGPA